MNSTSNLKTPPGPNHLVGLKFIQRFRTAPLELIGDLHRQYGDIVHARMGPYHTYFFYHPDQVKEILVDKVKLLPKAEMQVRVLRQWDGNGLVLSEGEFWARQRRLVQPAFHTKRFEGYSDAMVRKSENTIQAWMALTPPAVVDVDEAMTSLTLEIITKTLFDADISGKTKDLGKAVAILSETAVREMGQLIRLPGWVPLPSIRSKRWAMEYLDKTIRRVIAERRKTGADVGDLLSMLLNAVDSEDSKVRMTDDQARDEAVVMFLAGHDTTAAGLTWFWYIMGRYPDIQEKACSEVESVLHSNVPTYSDVARLPYLTAAIKETMRLFPPAIGVFARQAKEPMELGGYRIPKGSIVYAFSYVTHRDSRWFADPEKFSPERFMGENEKKIRPFAYFPFGAGPRACIGAHFAMTEMVLVAATLLRRFEFSLLPGVSDPEPLVHVSLRPKNGLSMRIRHRPNQNL
jgi:cytochrome P450